MNEDTLNDSPNDTVELQSDGASGFAEQDATASDTPERSVEEELTYVREQLLRTAAELQNYRRRTAQVRQNETAFAKASVIGAFLGILDDLERTLDAASDMEVDATSDSSPAASLRDGVALVHRKFIDELTRMGVTVIPSVGRAFDEELHEALMQQPAADDVAPGTIVGEIQKGYQMGDRVLRHAKVIVAA